MAENISKTQIVIWAGAIIIAIIHVFLFWKTERAFERLDLITVILTAVTVILAALAIGIAVAAMIGIPRIEERAISAALKETKTYLDTKMDSRISDIMDKHIQEKLEQASFEKAPYSSIGIDSSTKLQGEHGNE